MAKKQTKVPTTLNEADVIVEVTPQAAKPKAPVSKELVENIEKMKAQVKPMSFKITEGTAVYETINERPIEQETGKPTVFKLEGGSLKEVK